MTTCITLQSTDITHLTANRRAPRVVRPLFFYCDTCGRYSVIVTRDIAEMSSLIPKIIIFYNRKNTLHYDHTMLNKTNI